MGIGGKGDNSDDPAPLVARILAGDPRAETEVVERYGRGLRIILDRHTSGRPEAEDLYQDTLAIGLDKLRRGELRDPTKLPAFLSQLARNLAIEFYRKAQRRKTEPDSEAVDAAAVVRSSQLDRLVQHEHSALVRKAIEDMRNDRDRQVLFRFYIAEEDKDTIAADYDLSSIQFNRVLHRARDRYRELVQERLAAGFNLEIAMAFALWGAMIELLTPLTVGGQ